jgi:hypothetical protein
VPVVLQKAGGMPPNGFLPDALVLSSEVIDSGGVYLLDSGADLLLYVDQEAPERIVQVRQREGGAQRGDSRAGRTYKDAWLVLGLAGWLALLVAEHGSGVLTL